jgi:hypothetical protein
MYRKLHCLCHMWLEPTERKLRGISLTIVAFYYYLLRSGEYTKPRKVKRNGIMVRGTRTVQFKVKDVGLWKDGKILPRRSSLSDLLQADAATMKITNQKNGRTGQTLHHESTGPNGAVAVLARRTHHILSNAGSENQCICDVCEDEVWTSVTSTENVHAVRQAAKSLKHDWCTFFTRYRHNGNENHGGN